MNRLTCSLVARSRARFTFCLVAGLCALVTLTACAATLAPSRTLPAHIQRIYVREFKNSSRMYGLQADLTLFVNDEFLSDGRLDVVQSERSDVRLEGRIKSYKDYNSATGGERFPLVTTAEMVCEVELWDPYDTDRLAPMARYTVPASISYVSDTRRSIEELDVDARARLLKQMATNIFQAVMNGGPDDLSKLEKKAVGKWQQRHNPALREPVMQVPRFPRPGATPVPTPASGK